MPPALADAEPRLAPAAETRRTEAKMPAIERRIDGSMSMIRVLAEGDAAHRREHERRAIYAVPRVRGRPEGGEIGRVDASLAHTDYAFGAGEPGRRV
jgi:hypothetical protein